MRIRFKILFIITMTVALGFGFLNLFIPNYDFKRLHIFLYNLMTGGTILLYFTEQKINISKKTGLFFLLSLIYALMAFFEQYLISIFLGLILAVIVEIVRINRFGFLPTSFFRSKTSLSEKFHHAALLCLSIGLVIASFAIYNEYYVHWLNFDKLTLNTFFLGFSFPLSLITFSLVFETMENNSDAKNRALKEISFWTITLGVIIFFIFILYKLLILELLISITLFLAVAVILWMYIKFGIKRQQKAFLTSGISFLLLTATLGITVVSLYYNPKYSEVVKIVLHYHALIALYGWNLSGLAIICRFEEFPIKLNTKRYILLHWIIVVGFAPLGYYYKSMAIIALLLYIFFITNLFFSKGKNNNKLDFIR